MRSSFLSDLIEQVRVTIGEMAQLTSNNVDLASRALGKKKSGGLEAVATNEEKIDQLHSHIKNSLFKILARQSPVAGDLRMLLSLGRINDCLERMGDLTYSMSKDLQDYFENPPLELASEVSRMSNLLVVMLQMGFQCFFEKDPLQANEVLLMDKKVNQFRNELLVSLKEAMKISPSQVEGGFYLISVVRKFERIGDLVSTVAEEVIFSATGNNIRHQPVKGVSDVLEANGVLPVTSVSKTSQWVASQSKSGDQQNSTIDNLDENKQFQLGDDNGSTIES